MPSTEKILINQIHIHTSEYLTFPVSHQWGMSFEVFVHQIQYVCLILYSDLTQGTADKTAVRDKTHKIDP